MTSLTLIACYYSFLFSASNNYNHYLLNILNQISYFYPIAITLPNWTIVLFNYSHHNFFFLSLVLLSLVIFILLLKNIYLFIFEGWGQSSRERENPKQALCCQGRAWTWNSDPQTVRSWPELKSRVRQPTEPPRSPPFVNFRSCFAFSCSFTQKHWIQIPFWSN